MGRSSSRLRRGFAVVSLAWAGAVPGAAWLASSPAPRAIGYLAAVAVYAVGSIVCHQLPERSFFLWGRQLPVCARCTGIYAGAAVAAILFFAGASRLRVPPPAIFGGRARLISAVLASIPTAATLGFEWTTGVAPSNAVRAAAGLALGATIGALVLAGDARAMR